MLLDEADFYQLPPECMCLPDLLRARALRVHSKTLDSMLAHISLRDPHASRSHTCDLALCSVAGLAKLEKAPGV